MTEWALISLGLLVFSAIYCARKTISDFRGARPAAGVWGLVALTGPVSALTLALTVLLLSAYYH